MSDANLVILLTGAGVSALATVRILGPLVPRFLADHFSRPASPGGLVHGSLSDESGVIDDPIVALSADSKCADITLHGGTWVVEAAIEGAVRAGFVRTNAHDFAIAPEATGKLDAELQLALPLIRTELAAKTLLAQPDAWRAWLDSAPSASQLNEVLTDRSLHHLLHPPSVAIVGLPNAGKSTLANRLFGTDRSIVSPIAGTTRDWVGEEANLDGLIVKLIDTPGRHETPDPIERQAILQSESPIEEASLVIVLLDATRGIDAQRALLESFNDPLLVVNKSDCANAGSLDLPATCVAIRLSARDGTGLDLLVSAVLERFQIRSRLITAPRCWTRRQFEVLSEALVHPEAIESVW